MEKIKKIILKILKKDNIKEFWKKYNYLSLHKSGGYGFLKIKYKLDIDKIERKYNCFIPVSAEISDTTKFPHELNGIFIS